MTTPEAPPEEQLDYRFSLANERTYLAWMRTAVALIAGGMVAAKIIDFHHETWRWIVSVPPIVAGAAIAFHAKRRWSAYERHMRAGLRLPVGKGFLLLSFAIALYAGVVLVAMVLDG